MMDIERISRKIREEKDNIVAKAFTCQIASLLMTNGIVPIMTEYRKEDLDSITDTDRYKLVYELGVTFDKLDTSEHDRQIRAEAIEEVLNKVSCYISEMKKYYDMSQDPSFISAIAEAQKIRRIIWDLKEQNNEID